MELILNRKGIIFLRYLPVLKKSVLILLDSTVYDRDAGVIVEKL